MAAIDGVELSLTFEEASEFHALRCRGLKSPRTFGVIRSLLEQIQEQSLFEPRIAYHVEPVDRIETGCIGLQNQQELRAPIASHKLKKASHLLVGVCTLGSQVGDAVTRLFQDRKRLKAILMEELANCALFKLTRVLEAHADKEAGRLGLVASGPLNPGDSGFDLSLQSQLLDMAGSSQIGVDITSTQMMAPQHSLSVVFGLGKRLQKWTQAQNCEDCRAAPKCPHRIIAERVA